MDEPLRKVKGTADIALASMRMLACRSPLVAAVVGEIIQLVHCAPSCASRNMATIVKLAAYAQALSHRKGELVEMVPLAVGGKQRLVFEAPSRGLIGFRSAFATLTRGTGILHRAFSRYGRFKGPLDGVRKGALISTAGARPAPCLWLPAVSPSTGTGNHRRPL